MCKTKDKNFSSILCITFPIFLFQFSFSQNRISTIFKYIKYYKSPKFDIFSFKIIHSTLFFILVFVFSDSALKVLKWTSIREIIWKNIFKNLCYLTDIAFETEIICIFFFQIIIQNILIKTSKIKDAWEFGIVW